MGGEAVGQCVELAVGQRIVAIADSDIFRKFFRNALEGGQRVRGTLQALGAARPFLEGSCLLGEQHRDLGDRLGFEGIERLHQSGEAFEKIAAERLAGERAVNLQRELRSASDFQKQNLRACPLDPRVKIDPPGKGGLDEVTDFGATPCEA